MQIKTGDTVVVIAGKNRFTKDKKGNIVPTTGKVLAVYPKTNKVLVEGVNIVTKHKKMTALVGHFSFNAGLVFNFFEAVLLGCVGVFFVVDFG